MLRFLCISLRLGILIGLGTLAVAATAGVTVGPALELLRAAASPLRAADAWTLDRLVADLAAGCLLVAVTGFAMVSVLAMAATLAAVRVPALADACARVTPRRSRRLAAVLLGLGLAGPAALAGPAQAGQLEHAPACHPPRRPVPAGLGGLRLPDLPTTPAGRLGQVVQHRQVVVRRGDTLWHLAGQRLPDDASDAEIATLTWALYALNRSTIGEDPDLILPGMTLIAPEGSR